MEAEKICPWCQKSFIPGNYNQKYCSAQCGKKFNKKKFNNALKEKHARERAEKAKEPELVDVSKIKKEKPLTLAQVNALAREKHMTYGEYVMRYGG